jgi:transcriptional regulator with XRE-family HTH domain
MRQVSDTIDRALEFAQLTKSELARRVGVTKQSVNGWFNRGVNPTVDNLALIARETGTVLVIDLVPPGELRHVRLDAHEVALLTKLRELYDHDAASAVQSAQDLSDQLTVKIRRIQASKATAVR